MPIIMKGDMVVNNKVEPTQALPKKVIWDNTNKRLIEINEQPEPLKNNETNYEPRAIARKDSQVIEEPEHIMEDVPRYHEEHHGDLHKLYNTKSDYLSDMLALKDS